MAGKIMSCVCKHAAQDSLHGKGRRVHSEMKGTGGSGKEAKGATKKYRCTVCGHVK